MERCRSCLENSCSGCRVSSRGVRERSVAERHRAARLWRDDQSSPTGARDRALLLVREKKPGGYRVGIRAHLGLHHADSVHAGRQAVGRFRKGGDRGGRMASARSMSWMCGDRVACVDMAAGRRSRVGADRARCARVGDIPCGIALAQARGVGPARADRPRGWPRRGGRDPRRPARARSVADGARCGCLHRCPSCLVRFRGSRSVSGALHHVRCRQVHAAQHESVREAMGRERDSWSRFDRAGRCG
jgi:hypothetical protein